MTFASAALLFTILLLSRTYLMDYEACIQELPCKFPVVWTSSAAA